MRLILIFLATLAVPTAAGAALTDDEIVDAVNASFKLVQDQKFAEASAMIEPVISRYEQENWPKDQRVYCGHSASETVLYMGDAAAAGAKAVDIGAPYCDALFIRAYLQTEVNDRSAALATLERLRGLAPHNLKMLGRLDEALPLYDTVAGKAALASTEQLEGHWNAIALRGIGWIRVEQKRWAEGEQAYRDSQKFEPDNDIARHELEFIEKNRTD